MGSRGLAFVAVLAATFALVPATGGEARKKTCKVRGSHTDIQTRLVRVFDIGNDSRSTFFVCYRKTGKKTKIGVLTGPEQTYTYKVAGRFVPYLNSSPGRWSARLLDAKSGKLKFSFVILVKDGSAVSLVATPSGGLAFILDEETPEDTVRFVVGHKAGTGKHAYTKLTAGRPPDAHSLTRKGDVVSWRIYEPNTVPPSWITGSADLGR